MYYFSKGDALFRITQHEDSIWLIDEQERIEILLTKENKWAFSSLLKEYLIKKDKKQWQKSIEAILMDEFVAWSFDTVLDKPYLIYDIETTEWTWNFYDTYKFLLAYTMTPDAEHKMKYEYISQEHFPAFAQKLVDFDWYIIGFNSLWFDNPVVVANANMWQKELDSINAKSIDIFLFLWNLTWRRLSLNKVSETFVGIQKTLSSWVEWSNLWKKYQETWDKTFLEEFKKYCKNDVRMTALSFLYLIYYKKVFMEDAAYSFDISEILELWRMPLKEQSKEQGEEQHTNQRLF